MIKIFKKENKNKFLGIDLNPSYVSIVELSKDKNGKIFLENYASKNLIGGWMTDEIVKEEEQLGQFISNILIAEKIETKKCAIFLPTHTVMRKTFEVDKKLKEREIEDLIIHSGKKYIVQNIDEVCFDFKVLNEESKNNIDNKEVLLVASKKKNLTTREDALVIAGLEPKIVDIEQYIIENSFHIINKNIKKELNIDLNEKEKSVVALVEVIDSKLKLDLYINHKFYYSIEENFEESIVKSITNNSGLKFKNNLNEDLNIETENQQSNIENLTDKFNEEQIKFFNLMKKIINKVNYSFLASEDLNSIDVILLKGDNSKIDLITPILKYKIETPIVKIDPFNNTTLSDKININDLNNKQSSLFLAFCLALRGINT